MSDFGRWGSVEHHQRYSQPVSATSRRRCYCGCKTRATHRGMANGVCLYSGCELSVARWVRDATPMPNLMRTRKMTTDLTQ